MLINGICPVLVTPMNKDRRPSEEGTHKLVKFLIESEVSGLWMLGSASEDMNISREDRINLIKWVSQEVDGRIPIISGTGLMNIPEILEFIEDIKDCNLAGVHALYMDHKQSEGNMIREMTNLADMSPVPIWLYNNRHRGRAITPRIILELRDHDNIQGVKIGGNAISDLVNAAMHKTEKFQVIGAGGGGQCFTMLSLGCQGHTASDASCWPEEYVELFRLFETGNILAARELQFRLVKLNKNIGNSAKMDNGEFSAEEKYILSLRGICEEYVNQSYRCLTANEKEKVRNALTEYGFLWAPQ